jgi:hypothetical protein
MYTYVYISIYLYLRNICVIYDSERTLVRAE